MQLELKELIYVCDLLTFCHVISEMEAKRKTFGFTVATGRRHISCLLNDKENL